MKLAIETDCRYCHEPVFRAVCIDGRWRTFEKLTVPAAPIGVWAWRRHQGMQEQDLVPGKGLHYCPQYREAGRSRNAPSKLTGVTIPTWQ